VITLVQIETAGLPLRDKPLHDPAQPRAIQIAAVQFDRDRNPVNQFCCVFRRDGWTSSQGARAKHGIPERWNDHFGVDPFWALGMLIGDETRSGMLGGSKILAGDGLRFQCQMVEVEIYALARKRGLNAATFELPRLWTSTFRRAIEINEVAGEAVAAGRYLKLEDAHEALLGTRYTKTYRADRDLQAAANVFWRLVELGKVLV
jgi:hypothetical protein